MGEGPRGGDNGATRGGSVSSYRMSTMLGRREEQADIRNCAALWTHYPVRNQNIIPKW